MTGGIALILGSIGRNFAAGMSGGIAFLYNDPKFYDSRNFNMESIELEKPNQQDLDLINQLLKNHYTNTYSCKAKEIISDWKSSKKMFVKVMPTEYKLALEKIAQEKINQIIN